MMEIDWNRYKRTDEDDEESESVEEEEEDAWEDDYDREQKGNLLELTNDNFKTSLKKHSYMVALGNYPWCAKCKNEKFMESFSRVARNKKLKGKVKFAKVDLRQQRWVARDMDLSCPDEVANCASNIVIYRDGVSEGSYNHSLLGEDLGKDAEPGEQEKKHKEESDSMVTYFLRHIHPSPWPLKSMEDVDLMKKEGDKMMPIGFFGAEDTEAKAAFLEYVEEKRGASHHGIVSEPAAQVKLLKNFFPETADLLKPPCIVMFKNFGNVDEDRPQIFGGSPQTNDTFTKEGIENFVKYFNYQPLVWLNASESDSGEANIAQRKLPTAHLWLDDASKHPKTLTAVRRAAVQLQREVAFVYHDTKKESAGELGSGDVTDGARKQLLEYGLDGTEPAVFGITGGGFTESFPGVHERAYKAYPMWDFKKETTDEEIIAFWRSVQSGAAQPGIRSEAKPKEPKSSEKVNRLVGHDFVKEVMENEKDLLLNMYRKDQILHEIVHPELDKAAKVLQQVGANVEVFKYCWEDNDIPAAAKELEMIKRFTPVGTSLVFMLPGGKKGEGVNRFTQGDQGHHSAMSLVEAYFEHASKPFDLTKAKELLKEMSIDKPSPYQAACGGGAEGCKRGFSCEYNVCHWQGNAKDLEAYHEALNKPEPTPEELKKAKEEKEATHIKETAEKEKNMRRVAIIEDKEGGIVKHIMKEGEGHPPNHGAQVSAHYTGTLLNGDKFDSSRDRGTPFSFTLGEKQVIPCWDEGFTTMKKGERAILTCTSKYGYGDAGSGAKIPGGATLKFDVELLDFTAGTGKKEL